MRDAFDPKLRGMAIEKMIEKEKKNAQ